MLPCASRDARLELEVATRIVMAAWMLHGLRFGGRPAAVEPGAIGSSSVSCNEWLFMCA